MNELSRFTIWNPILLKSNADKEVKKQRSPTFSKLSESCCIHVEAMLLTKVPRDPNSGSVFIGNEDSEDPFALSTHS
jgi:hypothetical protein